jgi:hypothetical protein
VDKIRYFVDIGDSALLLPMDGCYLAGRFYFGILQLVPWLGSCFVRYYRNDVGLLALFIDFLVGV